MSSFLGQLNDNDIMAIISYMKSISVNFKGDMAPFKQLLKKDGAATAPSATQPAKAGTAAPTAPK